MANTIAKLWQGNLEPIANSGRNNPELLQTEQRMTRHQEALETALEGALKDRFEKYCESVNEYFYELAEQSFCDGFSLGTKITAEAITGAEQLL